MLLFFQFIYFQDNLSMLAEVGCYCGPLLSARIAWRLLKLESLTFIIKMYLLYFTIDSIFGLLEAFLLFKLKKNRYSFIYQKSNIFFTLPCLFSEFSNEEEQFSNCVLYITVWAMWTPSLKMLFMVAIQIVRWSWHE